MEDAQNFLDASVFYLKDTVDCLKRSLLVRAALSCLCAADCLAKGGNMQEARNLYLEAASIYEENSDRIIGKSVRESLWSLQEAYEYFLFASDYYRAQHIFEKYTSLARKINPFFGEGEAIENLRQRKNSVEKITLHSSPSSLKVSSEIHDAIRHLMDIRRTSFKNQDSNKQVRDKKDQNG